MKTLTTGTQTLMRMSLLIALMAGLALATVQRAEANQSGPTVNSQSELAIAICQGGGGTATVDVTRTVGSGLVGVRVRCTGGMADGMDCQIATWGTVCTFNFVHHDTGPTVPTLEGVEQVESTSDPAPEIVDDAIEPIEAEDPVQDVTEPGEDSATPTPETTDEPVIDEPEVVEEVVEPDVVEEPVQDSGPVVDPAVDGTVVEPIFVEEVTVEGIEVVDGSVLPEWQVQSGQ